MRAPRCDGLPLVVLALAWLGGSPVAAFTVTTFNGADFTDTAALDAAMGLGGLFAEGFEDLTLAPGLTMEHHWIGGLLDQQFSGTLAPGTGGITSASNQAWDGTFVIETNPDQTEPLPGEAGLTFHFAVGAGVAAVGISAVNAEWDAQLYVNGSPFGGRFDTYPDWNDVASDRNIFVKVTADPGETIESIGVTAREAFSVDHVAWGALEVPEPGTTLLLACAAAAIAVRRRPASRSAV